MSVLSDKWIKKMALDGMISPFEEKQVREGKDFLWIVFIWL